MNVERINEFKIMKALRYLLMVVAMVSVLSVTAQSTAQLPQVQMQSTSVMVSSGSTLPQAAATGTVLTSETPGSYSQIRLHGSQPRRSRPGDNEDPYKDPVGDAVWPLLALAAAYAVLRVYRRKRSV